MAYRRWYLLCLSSLLLILLGCGSKTPVDISEERDVPAEDQIIEVVAPTKPQYPTVKSPLTGLQIPDNLEGQRIIAIMVENEHSSRPQSGLDKACVVYEALAEGGITRFLALYLDESSEEIGPVRSSRPYFIDWAMEYDSVYVHYGASPHAYTDLGKLKIASIDGIYDNNTFWRDKTRKAPHNAYTSINKILASALQRKFRETSNFTGIDCRDQDTALHGEQLEEFSLTYFKDYKVSYSYDAEKKIYLRYINGKPHTDRVTGDTLGAKNIILQFVDTGVIPTDKEGRLILKTVGSGKGYYISNGEYVNIQWKKDSREAQTEYTVEDGGELKISPGNTWIQILPQWGEFQKDS
jgi:hypothetical protein